MEGAPARKWVVAALIAVLGVAVVAGSTVASASGPGHAVAAKKKCKKKKRSASSAKKKKCKVKHVVLPAPGPLVRASLTWGSGPGDEVDLHAYDASGAHAGWNPLLNGGSGGVENLIPNATHNGDVGPSGGTESFTDNIFQMGGLSNREFGYIACLYNGPGSMSPYTATFTGVTKSGQSSTLTLNGPAFIQLTTPGGPTPPNASSVC